MKKVYSFVPIQDFQEAWTDEKLYQKYGITNDEIAFINSMIRPMGDDDE
jgi:site-specific DNA-methyltransferase (adenine-specific)